jgi:hypothetical protein
MDVNEETNRRNIDGRNAFIRAVQGYRITNHKICNDSIKELGITSINNEQIVVEKMSIVFGTNAGKLNPEAMYNTKSRARRC